MSTTLPLIALTVAVFMALPAAGKEKSVLRFFIAIVISIFGVLVPLGVFLLSAFLTPEWKGGCPLGWLDCFHTGKLALAPLVLWASAALYALDVYRVARPVARWIVLGVLVGAVVSTTCLVYGCVSVPLEGGGLTGVLIVPLYVSVWYLIRAVQLVKASDMKADGYVKTLGGSLPFWVGSVILSRHTYQALPDVPPSCFVVSAASRGHRRVVGPFVETVRHGAKQEVNLQLLAIMRFEAFWSAHAPTSHRIFRIFYNRVGPIVARRITSPWTADLVYLLLKPIEFAARLSLCLGNLAPSEVSAHQPPRPC